MLVLNYADWLMTAELFSKHQWQEEGRVFTVIITHLGVREEAPRHTLCTMQRKEPSTPFPGNPPRLAGSSCPRVFPQLSWPQVPRTSEHHMKGKTLGWGVKGVCPSPGSAT